MLDSGRGGRAGEAPTTGRGSRAARRATNAAPNPKARAFTARWQAPTDTGGTALTGFRVVMRANGASWPGDNSSAVQKVGASARSYTFSGLAPNRIYWFKVKACNGANQTRCSGWSSQASVTLPIDSPGTPRWGSFSAEATQIRVTWSAPSDTGGVGLTGYGLRHWRTGASEPSSAQVVVNAQTHARTFSGLASDTAYRFSIQACNGTNRCSGWTNKDGRTDPTPTPPPPPDPTKPGRVGRPDVSPRDAALLVDWDAPGDGGSAITHYDVQHRAGTAGAWTATEVRSRTSTTISGLTNGTSYQVQVRAVNSRGDGEWSKTATGTPVATAPAPTDPPGSITPVNADCPETSSTATASGPPQNLDVAPLPQRQILLCWSPVSDATRYLVLATENPTAKPASRVWVSAKTRAAANSPSDDDPETNVIVDLTDMLLLTINRGLTTQEAIGLQVRAEIQRGSDPAYFEDSDMVIVVDSPIVAASVFRSNREEAHLSWRTAQSVLLDDNYAYGTYDLRYRLVSGNRQDRNWTPSNLGPRKVELGVSSPHTMRELTGESIYSIQWVYRKDNRASTHDADVYAARPVYIQTVEGPPVGYESSGPVVFAGFPMQYPMKTTTFEYRVCTKTFPAGQENDWTEFIKHAFGQWELATNFTVISMRYNNGPCTDYATSDVTEKILNKIKYHTDPDLDIEAEVKAFIRRATTMTKLRPLHRADSRLNEVVMLDDVEALGLGPAFKSRVVWVYSQLGSDIGYLGSEAPNSTNRKCWTEYPGCAVPTLMVDSDGVATGDGYSTDIFLLRSKAIGGLQRPGGDTSVDRSDVRLNQCPTGTSDTYGVLVHEAGHALGLRSADDSPTHPGETSPAMAVDSVMSVGDYVKKCAPYPLDVLAIRALYETR